MSPTFDLTHLFSLDSLVSLLTLSVLEIVLGIDNIIFVAIVTGKLPKENQRKARTLGLMLALLLRIGLLVSLTWIISFIQPLFYVTGNFPFIAFLQPDAENIFYVCSWRDIILFGGGIFLLVSSIREIRTKITGKGEYHVTAQTPKSVRSAIAQIMLIDIVFSFDSILTAIGLANNLTVMILAVTLAMIAMISFSGAVSGFINNHPTVKMLALAFLLLIAVVLIADGLHYHIDKKYIYFSLAFSLVVELLNLQMKKKTV